MKLTPGMKQYMDIKNANPDCIILFRMGDFYETFYEDAKTIARELEITLTSRGKGEKKAPLAGIPYHSIDPYIAKLVKKGYKVGIVEQTEDPKKAKGLVKRELIRIITPGTVVESLILDERNNNYLVSINKEKDKYGISYCDVSTGEFKTTEVSEKEFDNEIKRLNPAEIIHPMSMEALDDFKCNDYDDRHYYNEKALKTLLEHFNVANLEGFGKFSELMISSSGALLSYLAETQKVSLPHINKIAKYSISNFMHLDNATIRNLELIKSIADSSEKSTLVNVLDKTITPMGKRKLRNWITAPLKDEISIIKRVNAVEQLKKDMLRRNDLKICLEKMYDIERLTARISFGNASPKDLVSLKLSLREIPKIKVLMDFKSTLLEELSELPDVYDAETLINNAIKDEPNTVVREGNVIKKGYNKELDELRTIAKDGKKYISEMEEKEKQKTGIKSLKIKFNKVFGYFIEVTKTNLNLVPEHYIRKQTQVNSERYITEELKEMESKILNAEERIVELEYEIYQKVIEDMRKYINDIQEIAEKISSLDCLMSFSEVAQKNNYCKPSKGELRIMDGRHPVIEEFTDFVPNHCALENNGMMVITGPNAAGKSTYLRQVALIALMFQVGSFVPAKEASLPIFDRIFTRVGAHDNLVMGQSTFMVEMNETANILNNATEDSLVILDELGRGTSTYDGLSLAWAISEYLHTKIGSRTLFATHYHHLNKLSSKHKGIKNYNVVVDESHGKITFLHKIVEGGTDKSYGIEVARLAGIPQDVVSASKKVMREIEKEVEMNQKPIKKDLVSLKDFI